MKNQNEQNKYFKDYYCYELSPEKIAAKPRAQRTDSKLLVVKKSKADFIDTKFSELPKYLKKGDLLVFNDTKVIKARVFGKKETGGKVEIFLVRPAKSDDSNFNAGDKVWLTLVNPSKSIKVGAKFDLGGFRAKVIERRGNGQAIIEFSGDDENFDFSTFLNRQGQIPLPPYINRRRERSDYKKEPFLHDEKRYQTVYAENEGSVAAPTAGLHFSEEFLESFKKQGIETAYVTLHVGLGTFKPIKLDDIRSHKMEKEWFSLNSENLDRIKKAKNEGRRIIAVGTTSVRVLESVFAKEEPALTGWTDLYIYPGFDFKIVDAMITNFHLPGSTLILLVSALAGRDKILNAYEFAKNNDYRFYSYGDAMFIE